MSSSYPHEGPTSGYTCPKCKSSDIECTMAMYEFSTLVCRSCGNSDTVDDWQIDDWVSVQGRAESREAALPELCATCVKRGDKSTIREPYSLENSFDPRGGLKEIPSFKNILQCPKCYAAYLYYVEESSMFHDYDEYHFSRLNPETSEMVSLLSSEKFELKAFKRLEHSGQVDYQRLKSSGDFSPELTDELRLALNVNKGILEKLVDGE